MDTGEGRSSSNELSSAPNSDIDTPPVQRSSLHLMAPGRSSLASEDSVVHHKSRNGVGDPDAGSRASAATSSATPNEIRQDVGPTKIRKPRKKKDLVTMETEKKDKPARKPRSDKGVPKKKPKLEHAIVVTDSSKVSTRVAELQNPAKQPTLAHPHLHSTPPHAVGDDSAKNTQIGISRQTQEYQSARPNSADSKIFTSPPQPPARSTAIYDPVRSLTIQRPADNPPQPAYSPKVTHTPPRPASTPGASPFITSIINPPAPTNYSLAPPTSSRPPAEDHLARRSNSTSEKIPPSEMEIDSPDSAQSKIRRPSLPSKPSPDGPNNVPSPKPTRAKEKSPPAPPGSGLLSSSLFGGEAKLDGQAPGGKVPNIVLHVDLKGKSNQVINFAKMAEDKYGFAALYPRQAAQKERLAKVAAAGAALERSANSSKMGGSMAESGDEDVSVDIDRDSDNEGDVTMSGVNGGHDTGANSGTDTAAPKRRRRKKLEEYDQDDPFVDDSELVWEAQAAASKDGFFVYCGPLVPEGEKPAVERADGTVKRGRGRGRGNGLGSRGGRGGASAAVHSDAGGGRAGGPGTRGGATTRKPRITKADRAQREMEKANREKMAPLAAKPTTFPA